jgi:peptidoglycan/LPS O-acetylase OafA/YrhL
MKIRTLAISTAGAAAILAGLALAGCSSSTQSKISAWGYSHHIKQFSGGVLIQEWDSTGSVENEEKSDGKYWQDRKTGKLVAASGDLQITVNDF